MAGPTKKSPSIPTWQQQKAEDIAAGARETETSPSDSTATNPNPSLLDHASRFLEDDSIKDAPVERKREFLKGKGLSDGQIQELLKDKADGADQTPLASITSSDLKTIHDSTTSTVASSAGSSSSQSQAQTQTQSRDAPPIITYPEFLLQQQKPPPLITVQRLLYAIYGVSAVTATAYGTNKYLVEPMVASLSDSRHDLFSTTLALLQKLNQKLEANVSHIPVISKSEQHKRRKDEDDDDVSSIASDPTELFHRDIATQTSPSLIDSFHDSSSRSSTPVQDQSPTERSERLTTTTTSRLNNLRSNLTYLLSTESLETDPNNLPPAARFHSSPSTNLQHTTKTTLSDLQEYLETLPFGGEKPTVGGLGPSPYDFSSYDDMMVGGTPAAQPRKGAGAKAGTVEEDEISKMKKEIRGLKGALLSSRNFPMAR